MYVNAMLHKLGRVMVLDTPPELLREQRRQLVRLTVEGVAHRTYACRMSTGESVVIVPHAMIERLCLVPGQHVQAELSVYNNEDHDRMPADLLYALEAAGCDLTRVHGYERHQFITIVTEAQDPDIRRKRIEAIVASLQQR